MQVVAFSLCKLRIYTKKMRVCHKSVAHLFFLCVSIYSS